MYLCRELQPYEVLNTSVEFIKELKGTELEKMRMQDERVRVTCMNDTSDERVPYIRNLINNDRDEPLIVSVSDKYVVTIREDYHRWIFAKLKTIAGSRVIAIAKQYTDENGDRFETFGGLSDALSDVVKKAFKINKKMQMTLVNFIRMLVLVNGFNIEEKYLKEVINKIKAASTTYYLYKTQKFVAEHYKALMENCNLSSCMTHGQEHFGNNAHYVPCLESTAQRLGAEVKTVQDNLDPNKRKTFAMVTVNVEGYSGGDLWLGLVSQYSPDELAQRDDYGFCGRTIVFERDGELKYVRYYGDERVKTVLESNVKQDNCVGMQFRAYRSVYAQFYGNIRAPRYITPYIDGANRHFRIDSENPKYDEYGREYYMATVMPYDSSNYNFRTLPAGDALHGVYRTGQSDWLTDEEWWTAECCLSGDDVENGSGRWSKKFNGYIHMRYGEHDGELDMPRIIKELEAQYKSLEEQKQQFLKRIQDNQERITKVKAELGVA